jgi:hypothetical protein
MYSEAACTAAAKAMRDTGKFRYSDMYCVSFSGKVITIE